MTEDKPKEIKDCCYYAAEEIKNLRAESERLHKYLRQDEKEDLIKMHNLRGLLREARGYLIVDESFVKRIDAALGRKCE